MVPSSATSNSFEKRPEHPIGSARFSAYCRGMKKTAVFQTGAAAGVWTTAPLQRQPNLRQRILVVDDDPLIRRLNSEVLVYSGYQVDAADDGASAWNALLVNDYDLLITDNDMPKVTGVDLLKKVHASISLCARSSMVELLLEVGSWGLFSWENGNRTGFL